VLSRNRAPQKIENTGVTLHPVRFLTRLLLFGLAVATAACASSGSVPRPFPGAPLPPSAARPAPAHEPAPGSASPPSTAAPPTAAAAVPPAAARPGRTPVDTALALRGAPYRDGGTDPSGFDCSGFVQYVFARHGVSLPREAKEQFTVGKKVKPAKVRPGDLLFFSTVAKGPSHVGLSIGGDQFVHAPSERGVVRVERITDGYWGRRFVGARRPR